VIAEAVARQAPIDAFGVGTKIGVSADAPYLDMAYKLVAYAGRPVLKLSTGKATWPGPKQVWRATRPDGGLDDCIAPDGEPGPPDATPLLTVVMHDGQRLGQEPLTASRDRARREIGGLPAGCRRLDSPTVGSVRFSEQLRRLRDESARQRQEEAFGQPTSIVAGNGL
jgi:nicotinate phosphoribosyltransferase